MLNFCIPLNPELPSWKQMGDSSKTFPNLPIQVRRLQDRSRFILQNTLKNPRSIQRLGTTPLCLEIILLFPRNLRSNQSAHEEWKKPILQSAFFYLFKKKKRYKVVGAAQPSHACERIWDLGKDPVYSYECSSLPCPEAAPRWLLSNSAMTSSPWLLFRWF